MRKLENDDLLEKKYLIFEYHNVEKRNCSEILHNITTYQGNEENKK